MNKTRRKEFSITLTSLSSTFENCLQSYAGQVERWLSVRNRAKEELEEYRPTGNASPDLAEFDRRNELWHLHEGRTVAYLLLLDLYVAVCQNPFPGQQLRLRDVALKVFPDAEGSFAPGRGMRGKAYWKAVFREFDLFDGSVRVNFPVETKKVSVRDLERKLLALACGRDFVPVKEAAVVLPWKPSSTTYRYVKGRLQKVGWRWGLKRLSGNPLKVIFVPETAKKPEFPGNDDFGAG